jgi:hypothetical protein
MGGYRRASPILIKNRQFPIDYCAHAQLHRLSDGRLADRLRPKSSAPDRTRTGDLTRDRGAGTPDSPQQERIRRTVRLAGVEPSRAGGLALCSTQVSSPVGLPFRLPSRLAVIYGKPGRL